MARPKFSPLTATVTELLGLLGAGKLRSVDLIETYMSQISKYNGTLKAVWATRPLDDLLAEAKQRDDERDSGRLRGPLHGVPYMVKDNTDTDPKYGLDTTAGCHAFIGNQANRNADLVDSLEGAGAILIGKATLSEMNFWKASGLPCGWSAIAGQGQSAYVRGGVDPEDTFAGHSSPGGSSSGSAIAVSAGFVPFTTGTETDGSVIVPANRAGLYSIKPTFGLISGRGIVPINLHFDTPGLMAKSAADIGTTLDVVTGRSDFGTAANNQDWSELRIGALDPGVWRQPPDMVKPNEDATAQMTREINAAYDIIQKKAKAFHRNIQTFSQEQCLGLSNYLPPLYEYTYANDMNKYLSELESSRVKKFEELVSYNKEHPDVALPGGTGQNLLEASLHPKLNDEQAASTLAKAREIGRSQTIDKTLKELDIDVIIGPSDSPVTKLPSAAGYPIVTMPLGYLDFNGRPFGLVAIASAHQEETLMKVLGAWEATMPKIKPPPALVED